MTNSVIQLINVTIEGNTIFPRFELCATPDELVETFTSIRREKLDTCAPEGKFFYSSFYNRLIAQIKSFAVHDETSRFMTSDMGNIELTDMTLVIDESAGTEPAPSTDDETDDADAVNAIGELMQSGTVQKIETIDGDVDNNVVFHDNNGKQHAFTVSKEFGDAFHTAINRNHQFYWDGWASGFVTPMRDTVKHVFVHKSLNLDV